MPSSTQLNSTKFLPFAKSCALICFAKPLCFRMIRIANRTEKRRNLLRVNRKNNSLKKHTTCG